MGKVKEWGLKTQQEEWDSRWELRIIELVKEYPNYSSDEIA